MKITAEIDVRQVNGKDAEEGVTILVQTDPEDEQVLILVIEDADKDKRVSLAVDRDDLLEAVARLSGTAYSEAVPKQEMV